MKPKRIQVILIVAWGNKKRMYKQMHSKSFVKQAKNLEQGLESLPQKDKVPALFLGSGFVSMPEVVKEVVKQGHELTVVEKQEESKEFSFTNELFFVRQGSEVVRDDNFQAPISLSEAEHKTSFRLATASKTCRSRRAKVL
ncbi:MAG: hypothetical protein AB1782_04070 [Cyanobacteriota bacterium]